VRLSLKAFAFESGAACETNVILFNARHCPLSKAFECFQTLKTVFYALLEKIGKFRSTYMTVHALGASPIRQNIIQY
jgi:hypothetical protein